MRSRRPKHFVKTVSAALFLVFFSTLSYGQTTAATEASSPLVINGRLWARYFYDATESSAHTNGFTLYRTYLMASYKIDPTWSGTLLLDGPSSDSLTTSATTSTIPAYVRNAYIQATDLWEGKGTFRFGLQPTLYVSTVDSATKTRWLGRNLADQTGLSGSQGAGAAVSGQVGSFLRYGVLIHNGRENLDALQADQDSGLSYSAILTFTPMADSDNEFARKIGFTVFDDLRAAGKTAPGSTLSEQGSNLLAFAIHGQSSAVDWAIELALQKVRGGFTNTRAGYGLTANYKIMDEQASLYARYFTGNDEFETRTLARKSLLTVGPTYSFIKDRLSTAVLYETRAALDNATGANAQDDRKIFWNWAYNF